MSRYDFAAQRLFVDTPLKVGTRHELDRAQANYLLNVLRMGDGAELIIFNGVDGEWRARVEATGRKSAYLIAHTLERVQDEPCDLHYLFAPIKHARLDFMVEKAVEMGASVLRPIITRRTQSARVNLERMRANAIEACEQCGIMSLPSIEPEQKFDAFVASFPKDRLLVFCDEDAPVKDPIEALKAAPKLPVSVLIGPEGGFDDNERAQLLALPNVLRVALGPRILRADTAAIAALSAVQAAVGDWR